MGNAEYMGILTALLAATGHKLYKQRTPPVIQKCSKTHSKVVSYQSSTQSVLSHFKYGTKRSGTVISNVSQTTISRVWYSRLKTQMLVPPTSLAQPTPRRHSVLNFHF